MNEYDYGLGSCQTAGFTDKAGFGGKSRQTLNSCIIPVTVQDALLGGF